MKLLASTTSSSSLLFILFVMSSMMMSVANAGSSASQEQDQTAVSTNKPCYEHGETVVVMFLNQFPDYEDRLAFYVAVDETERMSDVANDPHVWLWTCNHERHPEGKHCPQWGKFSFQFHDMPLAPGAYKVSLERPVAQLEAMSNEEDEEESTSFTTVVETRHFMIKQPGQTCDGSTSPLGMDEDEHHHHGHHHNHEQAGGLRGSSGAVVVRVKNTGQLLR
eukprot:CAMPEP_0119564494 /NCGR_PEP_ID=MMETSP1352-20130426/27148_1 /TAXON_ID=265584 /ORGANISM="Stauroneis constricta, Strain CCMP1120" /LENGTH=220 /DNA_ID=CAMNT_0007613259 /DNA_START=55 /DNA_END=717 /DNA_ORIENTATION=+